MGRIMERLYRLFDWISKLIYLNFLWIFFTLIGIILFGIMPATVALFSVIREMIINDRDISIFKLFYQKYRSEFFNSNALGFITTVFGLFLFFDIKIIINLEGIARLILLAIITIITFLYLNTILYLLPVYVHFNLRFFQYFKFAFYIGVINLHISIFTTIIVFIVCLFLIIFPGLLPFFSISLFSLITMFCSLIAFRRVEILKKNRER